MKKLLEEIRACQVCEKHLVNGVNPVLSAHRDSKIIIIGQAPGRIVHETGKPWDDKSGDRLREWLGVNDREFYDESKFAIIPMGFCYPGKGKSGDLPPRKECAPLWHDTVMKLIRKPKLTLLIGMYAQSYYLKDAKKGTLTETVKAFEEYLPAFLPLPHPSPRNNIWLKKNPWFEELLLPILGKAVTNALDH